MHARFNRSWTLRSSSLRSKASRTAPLCKGPEKQPRDESIRNLRSGTGTATDAERIELPSRVLETRVLPLNEASKCGPSQSGRVTDSPPAVVGMVHPVNRGDRTEARTRTHPRTHGRKMGTEGFEPPNLKGPGLQPGAIDQLREIPKKNSRPL